MVDWFDTRLPQHNINEIKNRTYLEPLPSYSPCNEPNDFCPPNTIFIEVIPEGAVINVNVYSKIKPKCEYLLELHGKKKYSTYTQTEYELIGPVMFIGEFNNSWKSSAIFGPFKMIDYPYFELIGIKVKMGSVVVSRIAREIELDI